MNELQLNIAVKPDVPAIVKTNYAEQNVEGYFNAVITSIFDDFIRRMDATDSCALREAIKRTIGNSYGALSVSVTETSTVMNIPITDSVIESGLKREITKTSTLGSTVINAIKAENQTIVAAYNATATQTQTVEARLKAVIAAYVKNIAGTIMTDLRKDGI